VKLVTAVCYFSMINIELRCCVSQKTPKYKHKNIKVRCNITTYCRASPNCIACHVNDIRAFTIVVINSYIAILTPPKYNKCSTIVKVYLNILPLELQ